MTHPMESQPAPKTVRRTKKKTIVRHKKQKPVPPQKRTPEQIAAIREKQEQALELRMTGATYNQIAKSLGYSNPSSAKAAVDSVINRTEREAATEVVALDLARLDEYQMRCTHALRSNGDLGQIDRLMRIMEMRYRLLGVSDETIKLLQEKHGLSTGGGTVVNGNVVMNVHAAPETEDEFIKKMMQAVGANPDSPASKALLQEHSIPLALPMLSGSANEDVDMSNAQVLDDLDIVEGEIVDEL
jgi:hypothetical protein